MLKWGFHQRGAIDDFRTIGGDARLRVEIVNLFSFERDDHPVRDAIFVWSKGGALAERLGLRANYVADIGGDWFKLGEAESSIIPQSERE